MNSEYMTVGELRAALVYYHDDVLVLVSEDDEGNSFRGVPKGWLTPSVLNDPLGSLWRVEAEDIEMMEDTSSESPNSVVIG